VRSRERVPPEISRPSGPWTAWIKPYQPAVEEPAVLGAPSCSRSSIESTITAVRRCPWTGGIAVGSPATLRRVERGGG
jgi:hypothetical protein